MKDIFMTAAAMMFFTAPLANAQSNVTLYGNLDSGVAYFNNVNGKSLFTTADGNYIPNMFGFTGSEDLGGGLKAIFKLETGYLLNSGKLTVPGQIFQREAKVGVQSDAYGTLTLGHQPSFMFDILGPYSSGYMITGFYTLHQGNFDELANTFEFNNSVKYVSPYYGGLKFGAQFGFGNQTNFAAGRNYSFTVQYKTGPLSLGAVYSNENDRFLEMANFVGLKSLLGTPLPAQSGITANNVQNWGVGGTYTIGNWVVHGLFTQSRISTATGSGNASTVDGGVNYSIGKFDTLGLGGSVESFDGGHWATVSLANTYSLSKRTSLYQTVMYQKASGGNAVAAMLSAGQSSTRSQFGVIFGIQHFF